MDTKNCHNGESRVTRFDGFSMTKEDKKTFFRGWSKGAKVVKTRQNKRQRRYNQKLAEEMIDF